MEAEPQGEAGQRERQQALPAAVELRKAQTPELEPRVLPLALHILRKSSNPGSAARHNSRKTRVPLPWSQAHFAARHSSGKRLRHP
jgi:hypothetical protein